MAKENDSTFLQSWLAAQRKERGKRAIKRQLDYQEKKAAAIRGKETEICLALIKHSQEVRGKLEKVRLITEETRVLEVGSGAQGLIFGFGNKFKIGIDPLAVEYARLFPAWQRNAQTIAAIGEKLPFADAAFDVVLSDNVIDHAEKPIKIVDELARVLKPGGLLYFTVNFHHPVYEAASKAHGIWNALGVNFEISPFADHTVHLTKKRVKKAFDARPFQILEENASYRKPKKRDFEGLIKKVFFKNALLEIVALRK